MIAKQLHSKDLSKDSRRLAELGAIHPQLVLAFGSVSQMTGKDFATNLRKAFPESTIMGCTTAGEITNDGVHDDTSVITAVKFDKSRIKSARAKLGSMQNSRGAGIEIGQALKGPDLTAVMVLSQGLGVNGSALVLGIHETVGKNVVLTGGLAGDGGKFQKTFTLLNDEVSDSDIVAIGFYGKDLRVHFGSMGGWEAFGPVRKVTKAAGNILYQLDGKPALEVYKEYLGEHSKSLPAAGLLFPFELLRDNEDKTGLIRTILGLNEAEGSLTLAGDMPEGAILRLMHARSGGLVEGAKRAAESARGDRQGLAVLISCVGRKIVMGDDVDDEIDAVRDVFTRNTMITGFYSYGEICPLGGVVTDCRLHNQTMTITYIDE